MNRTHYNALRRLLDYVREDERKSWEEAGEPTIGHIYENPELLTNPDTTK